MSRQKKNMFVPERLLVCAVGIGLTIIAFPTKPYEVCWERVTFLVLGVILFIIGVSLEHMVNFFNHVKENAKERKT